MTATAGDEGRLLGAVLAGGKSSRFGSDKALATLAGVPLAARAAETLAAVCDEVVVVSSRPEHDLPGFVRIPDLRSGVGPLAAVEAALAHADDTGAAAVFVLACDLPSVDATLVRRVVDGLGDGWAASPSRVGDPGFEPLCSVYRTSCLEPVRALLNGGRREARTLFEAVKGHTVAGAPGGLPNVNRPDDLEAWRTARGGPKVVSVIGKKKSGKTTTVVGLVAELVRRGREVVTVKHGHGFSLDHEGTDSWKHRHDGGASRVVLAGPDEFAVVGRWGPGDGGREPSLATLVARFGSDADVVVAEGFKTSDYPCIEVYRTAAHARPLYGDPGLGEPERWLAVLTDDPSFEAGCPVLDADAPERFRRLADLVLGLP